MREPAVQVSAFDKAPMYERRVYVWSILPRKKLLGRPISKMHTGYWGNINIQYEIRLIWLNCTSFLSTPINFDLRYLCNQNSLQQKTVIQIAVVIVGFIKK